MADADNEYPFRLKAGFCLVFGILSLLGISSTNTPGLMIFSLFALICGIFIYLKGRATESVSKTRDYIECIIRMKTRDFWLTPLFYVLLFGYFLALTMSDISVVFLIATLCSALMLFYAVEYSIALFKIRA